MDNIEPASNRAPASAIGRAWAYLIEGSKDTPKWVWSVVALVVFFLAVRVLAPLTGYLI